MEAADERKTLIEWIYKEFSQLVWLTAVSYIGETDAEDAVQEMMLTLLEHPEAMEGRSLPEIRAYLIKVTKNHCIDILRRAEKHAESYEWMQETYGYHGKTSVGNPMEQIEEEELIELLKRSLRKLKPETRIVMEQRLRYHLSNQEIAAQLKLSKMTVEKRISRGRQEIRRVMRGVGYHV